MRTLKFRAWNFKHQKMFSAEEMTADQMAILPDGHFANIDGQHTSRSIIYSHEQMLPMQYTGLKDRNGKEIYEGDIVQYKTDTILVEWHGEAAAFWPFFSDEYWNDDFEIIGTRYETPDLLTSSNDTQK